MSSLNICRLRRELRICSGGDSRIRDNSLDLLHITNSTWGQGGGGSVGDREGCVILVYKLYISDIYEPGGRVKQYIRHIVCNLST